MAKFSKIQYTVISKAISDSFDMVHYLDEYEYRGALDAKTRVVEQLTSAFKKDNPKFDEVRFMKDCGF